jgi:hypothetical protein
MQQWWQGLGTSGKTGEMGQGARLEVQLGSGSSWVRFFWPLLFSTTWPGLFLGSFPVRFFHSYVFSTTSPLRFSVRFRFVFCADPLFSTTSPVRFQKKVFFFVFPAQKLSKNVLFSVPQQRLSEAAEAARLPMLRA